MIQVSRIARPKVLTDNATKWTMEYLVAKNEYEADKTNTAKKNNFKKAESKYNHEDVKLALRKMFSEKCAYCESDTTHVSYGEIEHFKPKSKYPELCFEWKNMNFSCEICNGKSHKGDKFPLEQENGPIINPVDENPDEHFKFYYDSVMDSALLIPLTDRAKTTLSLFKLNDRMVLTNHRTKEIRLVSKLKAIADNGNEDVQNLLKSFSYKNEYYAFIKAIIQAT